MFKCNLCPDKSYATQKSLNKHDREVHSIFKETLYQCENNCRETFTSKRKLLHHLSNHTKNNNYSRPGFNCEHCGNYYSARNNLNRHIRQQHGDTNNEELEQIHNKSHSRLLCPIEECEDISATYKYLRSHLAAFHEMHLKKEVHEFNNKAEFNIWKSETEHALKANYVKDTSQKQLKSGGLRTYYICHRSLGPRLIENPQRNSKSMGTNKIGRACPSTIITTCNSEEKVSVIFYPMHMDHSQELGRLRISEEEKLKIAGKLSQGVTVDRVLHDVRENVPNGQIGRVHLLEKKDINNIIRDYSIGYPTKRHKNDAVSVKLWVNTMQKLEHNPILYYKEQSEEKHIFHSQDFVLIIMTEFQKSSLIAFGNNKICIDGTHGLNQYGFQLYTILVVDEFGSGIPIAFCFSNRSDIVLFQLFFECVKKAVGHISTKVFMSDDYPAFYNAWESVMGGVSHRLLCTWHVNRNWVQSSNKISNKEKRSLVLKTLKVIQKELDEELFLKQLDTFNNQLISDPDTFEFFQYFSRTYLNRTNMWAYCYRKYTGINTNMYLESLHKTIKHFYLQGRKCKRLDKTINALMNLVRDKMFESVIKFEKHKNTCKIQKIRNTHKNAEKISLEQIKDTGKNQWNVLSSTDSTHSYTVEKVFDTCRNFCELKCEKCQICVHSYKCSCPDSVINLNICKHIHLCCLQRVSERTSSTSASFTNCTPDFQYDLATQSCSNKDLINSKLEVILGLNNKCNLDDKNVSLVSKQLDKIIEIYNSNGLVNFSTKEKINVTQRIEPQTRTFSHKSKKKIPDNSHLSNFETKVIKLSLSDPDSKVPNIQKGFDHTYTKT